MTPNVIAKKYVFFNKVLKLKTAAGINPAAVLFILYRPRNSALFTIAKTEIPCYHGQQFFYNKLIE
jgi:hypothetical protein